MQKVEKLHGESSRSMKGSVRLQNSVCLLSCWSKLSNTQNPATEGGGLFFVDLGLEKHVRGINIIKHKEAL